MSKNVREEDVCPREGSTRSESSSVHATGLERDMGEGQSRQESAGRLRPNFADGHLQGHDEGPL